MSTETTIKGSSLLGADIAETVRVTVMKFDPSIDREPHPAIYEVPYQDRMRVIDALDYITEQLGADVAYQWFCGAKKCGMCGIRMNGRSILACWEAAEREMLLEPLPRFPIVRDLVIDRSDYDAGMAKIDPALTRSQPYAGFPERLKPEDLEEVIGATKCIECQICTSVCPAYDVADDFAGPATVIQIGRRALDPRDGADHVKELMTAGLDSCLGCMACEDACPLHVPYGHILTPLRGLVARAPERPITERALRSAVHKVVVKRSRMRVASRLGMAARVLPMPSAIKAITELNPVWRLPRVKVPQLVRAQGERVGKVVFLQGCVQSVAFADVNAATVRVLAAEGYEVACPEGLGCCGALSMHSGRTEEGLSLAKRLIDACEGLEFDYFVTNVAGCGSHLKELAHLFRKDRLYHEKAARMCATVRDLNELLAGADTCRAPRHPLPMKVAYQDACHLLHAQGIYDAPRRLLHSIPDLVVLEPRDQDRCCGSAGIYNLVRREQAQRLGHEKARQILEVAPDAYVSANPGCLMQVTASLRRLGHPLPAFQPVELLDASLRGMSLEELLSLARR